MSERSEPEYADIPGTYVQDGQHTRRGYALNMFLMTLNTVAGRDAFRAGEAACLDGWRLTDEQRRALLERDWLGMLRSGANVYYLLKLAAFDGVSVQHVCAQMGGVSEDEFRQMMIGGGRSPESGG